MASNPWDFFEVGPGEFNTSFGSVYNINKPTVDMIDPRDIAMGLSNICRWGGQIKRHYSVGQPTLYVAAIVPEDLVPEALLHDAAEAYLGDVISPLKVILGRAYKDLEAKCMRAICEKFQIDYFRLQLVKPYDIQAMENEFNHFFKGKVDTQIRALESYGKYTYEALLLSFKSHFPNLQYNAD